MTAAARRGPVRYAVVGLGWIAQAAVLPAFAHARRNARLTALVSGNPEKLRTLARRYDVGATFSYAEYDECLHSGAIDAVYIALPNHLHHEYAVRAAEAGIHVLCEKPLAVTVTECEEMMRAARRNDVWLMTAYRLHFERTNLEAIEAVRAGRLGEPRLMSSVFTMQVKEGNVRLLPESRGGGPIYDLGVYCINAARSLYRAEPVEVIATAARGDDPRFADCMEMVACSLRFPGERLANFSCSFGAAPVARYHILGTEGDLHVDAAYEIAETMTQELTVEEHTQRRRFRRRDQFAPELIYFSDCILSGAEPEPSGREGLADVRVIEAALESIDQRRAVRLPAMERRHRPSLAQEIHRRPVARQPLVEAEPASR